MPTRTFDLDSFWRRLAAEVEPSLRFRAESIQAWRAWRRDLTTALQARLGPDRPAAELHTEVVERKTYLGYTREKIVYDTEPGVSVSAYVLVPRRMTGPAPGLVCLHGHGNGGKSLVAGEAGLHLRRRRHIWRSRYNVAEHFARRGYVCLCPDARGWGDRSDGFWRISERDRRHPFAGRRDPCNMHFLNAQIFGITLLWLNIWDAMRALDVLARRADVDADRLGAVGLSWGGTQALWLAALDARVRAAVVSCALTRIATQTITQHHMCGSQILPGMQSICDLGDVGALVAPRPLLFESGLADPIFPVEEARHEFEVCRRAYALLGVPERCEHRTFEGAHRFDGERTYTFVERWLRDAPPASEDAPL
ncbi:MAG: alpha/beta fold hydrolase [Myxococcales bacterium]|nr:alpha/beta fold hydrolase [Myxococcales bacterium]